MHPSPSRSISVRRADLAEAADREAVRQLVDAYARDPLGIGRPLSNQTLGSMIAGLRAHPASVQLLAHVDGRPAGLAVCFYGFSTFGGRRLLNVHDLAVLAEYRRLGVGTRLLAGVEAEARRNGCCKVTLEVRVDNGAAKSLYGRFGFSPGEPPYEFWTCPL